MLSREEIYRLTPIQTENAFRHALAVRPDGKVAASTGAGGALAWDLDTAKERCKFMAGGNYALKFAPDGQWLLAGIGYGSQTIAILDANGKEHGKVGKLNNTSLDIARDGTWAVASTVVHGGKPPAGITFFKVPKGEIIKSTTFDKGFNHIVLSPDNRYLYGGAENAGNGELWIWKIKDFALELVKKQPAHSGGVLGMALSKDGKALLTSGNGSLKQWSVPEGEQKYEWQIPTISTVWCQFDIAPDSRHAAVGAADGRVIILRLKRRGESP